MNQAMQKLTDVNYQTSEQHNEMGKARTEHDHKDASTFLEFLKERNPFTSGTNLRNIEAGVIADGKVDVDRSVEFFFVICLFFQEHLYIHDSINTMFQCTKVTM